MSPRPAPESALFPGPPRFVLFYAGFWWRVLAFVLDWLVLGVADRMVAAIFAPPRFVTGHDGPVMNAAYVASAPALGWAPGIHVQGGGAYFAASTLLGLAYFVLLESSAWQGTIGKRVCRLRVTDLSGNRITPSRALLRYFAKYLSALTLGIGFLMAGWTHRKQALHDLMVGTLVMRLREADSLIFAPPGYPESFGEQGQTLNRSQAGGGTGSGW
ncbi:RDD family protein [Rhizosaccharibacter radicis]|uniref:RDD family protein n=1 Tax=Rhizosaccharibacter radicis TaxID=2782605 RepID=A0ABT1VVL4_9PROT|nr:RDD family protein [Acetobacteraceae bacterium KSS12]